MYVVAWNREQCESFTVETLEEHIQYNLTAFHQNTSANFAMLGLFKTKQEASDYCATLQAIRNERIDLKG